MVMKVSQWGRWKVQGLSLVTYAPSGYCYQMPLSDLKKEDTSKIWIGQLSVKPWITIEDLFDLKRAIRELSG
jgi:hypothetical protein